jgi:selenocysteine lyase/cysteine desulfurase
VKLPVRELASVVRDHNRTRAPGERALLCLDGVHGFGVEAQTPAELGVDFLVSGCHKWLFGPRGTGIVWGRRDAWSELAPTIPSFAPDAYAAWLSGSRPTVAAGQLQTPGGFHSFEHRWALGPAFRWRLAVGRVRVADRTHALVRRLRESLEGGRGFDIVNPRDARLSAGLVMLRPHDRDPADVVAALARRKIVASVTPYRERYLRLGPSIVNDEGDVDAAVRALAAAT